MALFRRRDPRTRFVSDVETTLRSLGVTGPVVHDEDLFALRLADETVLMLGSLFSRWEALPKREGPGYLEAAVARLIADADRPDGWEDAKPQLRPGVRDRTAIEAARWMAVAGGDREIDVPVLPLTSTILAVVVVDSPHSMAMVEADHLRGWGVSFDEAFAVAIENLAAATDQAVFAEVDGSVYVSQWNDDYDAARLLLPSIIDALDVVGRPVAFVPHRNRLIVTGSDDADGLARAMSLTERELDHPSQISALPMVRTDGGWDELELSEDHLAAAGLHRLRAVDRSLGYGATTPLIQAAVGDDTYVANALLAEKDGELVSTATWIDAPTSIIPHTDRILFFRSEAENWMVAWDDVVAELGDRMEPTDAHPPRYRVGGFPTDSELERMPTVTDWAG